MPIPHRIERTKNRHSRAVLRDGVIIIRLARRLSAGEEREHVAILLRRMEKITLRERSLHRIEPFLPLLHGATDTLTIPLPHGTCRIALHAGTVTRGRKTAEGWWHVTVGPRAGRRSLHRLLWKILAHDARPSLTALVRTLNAATLQVTVLSVRLRYATSQWGSCSGDGRISLNPALLFVPPALLRYVVIHELAHRLHRGHSASYWKTVAGAFPAWKSARKALHNFRLPSL